jgi:hypothetical protein
VTENLVPGEKALLDKLALLLESDSSRFEIQAAELLKIQTLDVQCNSVVIRYKIKDGYFYYKYRSHSDGALQESKTLAPEKPQDQLQSLIFMFALSEAKILA